MGSDYTPVKVPLKVAETIKRKKSDRLAYIPVVVDERGEVRQVSYHGSAHIHALTKADGYLAIPVGVHEFPAGETVAVTLLS